MTDIENLKQEMHIALTDVTATDIRKCIDYLHSRGYLGGVWQPIETAPTDINILLYCPEVHITNRERIEVGYYRNMKSGSMHSWATHWQPLPAAPKGETK